MKKLTWKTYAVIGVLLLVIVIVWYVFIPGSYDEFAKCLTEKGAVMYGAEWCHNCKEQKMIFGKSFKYVDYVECPQNPGLCKEKGIEGYPTWIIDGISYEGVRSLETLSSFSGCPLSRGE